MADLEQIKNTLLSYKFTFMDEADLQTAVEDIFDIHGIKFIREYNLSEKDRIDFLIGKIGLEVKVGFSYAEVVRQLHRYAQSDEIENLILLTSRLQHVMPKEINGKTLCTVNISLQSSL